MAFIMSHGNEKGIVGIDGSSVTAETLSSYITPKECKQLENKPKIFFIQACRGSDMDIVMDEFKAAKDGRLCNYISSSTLSGYHIISFVYFHPLFEQSRNVYSLYLLSLFCECLSRYLSAVCQLDHHYISLGQAKITPSHLDYSPLARLVSEMLLEVLF